MAHTTRPARYRPPRLRLDVAARANSALTKGQTNESHDAGAVFNTFEYAAQNCLKLSNLVWYHKNKTYLYETLSRRSEPLDSLLPPGRIYRLPFPLRSILTWFGARDMEVFADLINGAMWYRRWWNRAVHGRFRRRSGSSPVCSTR